MGKSKFSAVVQELRAKIIQFASADQLIALPENERVNFQNYKLIPAALLVNATWNYKKESEKTQQHLENSIIRQGQVENINVREMKDGRFEVGNGNHRNSIFQQNGQEYVLCYVHEGITEVEFQARCIAQNETRFDSDEAKLSGLVRSVLETYGEQTFDILPFDDDEINSIINHVSNTAPPPQYIV